MAFSIASLKSILGEERPGASMHALAARLYPLCRSITGKGVRQTLSILREAVPLEMHEVPTGTQVLDWTVPREWNIRDAWIKNARGERVIDFQACNLHVAGYSVPVRATMTLEELRPRLHSLPDKPDLIPYRNSFYKEDWGFCLSHRQLQNLPDGKYEVCIDSTLADGHLTYGELTLPGRTAPGSVPDEVLISCHVCHPSLANDNLSGIAVAHALARYLAVTPHRHTYRLLFLPVTIGALTWLARNENNLGRVRHGLVLSLLGDSGPMTYKRSRRGDALVDRAAAHVMGQAKGRVEDFIPYGYDERQFCSPGFNLPVGCLMRTPHGRFPEYHTSGDNLAFIKAENLEDSLANCLAILDILERDAVFLNLNPKGEPQLGRRGLYRAMADRTDGDWNEMSMLWALNLGDGGHSLLDIAERSGLPFAVIRKSADVLREHGLLAESGTVPGAGAGKSKGEG
jgi:aminopeptidase-like protein